MSKPLGYAIIQDEWGVITEADTYSCCHCQQVVHIPIGPGIKESVNATKQRALCRCCYSPTCGLKECMENCTPFMKMIEASERREMLRWAMERV
jgi:hypothetical protein